jgi:hypothetical protein
MAGTSACLSSNPTPQAPHPCSNGSIQRASEQGGAEIHLHEEIQRPDQSETTELTVIERSRLLVTCEMAVEAVAEIACSGTAMAGVGEAVNGLLRGRF